MGNRVIIIGGGVAGMQAAITLDELGLQPVLIEKRGYTRRQAQQMGSPFFQP